MLIARIKDKQLNRQKMKIALITGANRSIGLETARQLAKLGYFVYLGCRDLHKGQETEKQLNYEGFANIESLKIDISNSASVVTAREGLGQKIDHLDVLINNAGISGGFPQAASSTNLDVIRKVFDTNFFGTIHVTQTFLDMLKKSDAPRIVNVTSGLASLTLQSDMSWPFYNFKTAAYAPSKTALNAYTIALAYELKDTLFKVNAVDPGYTATDFNNYRGTNDIPTAASYIVKYAILDETGPTGKFISFDNNPVTGESPW
jgi:NAD(P)-dependent dehydrogenase (short-subunit alcohol dehydrogenase family)